MKQKKGDIFQVLFLIIILAISAIIFLLTYSIAVPMNEAIDGFVEENTTAYDVHQIIKANTPTVFDEFILFLFLGGMIALCISAVRTNFSSTTIFLFILIIIISVAVASGFVNIYQGFSDAPGISDIQGDLTFTNIIFSRYFPLFICILSGIILILMYGKSGGDIVT